MSSKIPPLEKILFSISDNPSVRFLGYTPYYLERDIYNIASIVFNAESAIRLGYCISELIIPISYQSYNRWEISKIELLLSELLEIVLYRSIRVKLKEADTNKGRRYDKKSFSPCNHICLFSGGVDSTTGILKTWEKYKGDLAGVFVCHGDQGKIGSVVESIITKIEEKHIIQIDKVHAPKMYSEGYSQLRGFLYVTYASIFARLRKAKKILVTECGPTMYQTRFSPFDSITMTTHPLVMAKTQQLIRLFLKEEIDIIIPFEDLTKAEVATLNPFPDLFQIAHSCIGSRWIDSGDMGREANDGTCYGCVIRMLGLITAGLQDTIYEKNPLLDSNVNAENLLSVLAFSTEVLLDYDGIDDFTREIIDDYSKHDLFRRFALDNLAALHLLQKNGLVLNQSIQNHYMDVKNVLGTELLEKRIQDVRRCVYKANYRRHVK